MHFLQSAHEVTATRIVSLKPLLSGGQMMSPEQGVMLELSDGIRHKWIMERNGITPASGDFLITDEVLRVTYIVSAEKFASLFQKAED